MSMILQLSFLTGLKCSDLFFSAAWDHSRLKSERNRVLLTEFAREACKTSNPDVLWQFAELEGNFYFDLIRVNWKVKTDHVIKGRKAWDYITNEGKLEQNQNIDLGTMQINWRWHQSKFDHISEAMKPRRQVQYTVQQFLPFLKKVCGSDWVACYATRKNKSKAKWYRDRMYKSSHKLAKALNELVIERGFAGTGFFRAQKVRLASVPSYEMPSSNEYYFWSPKVFDRIPHTSPKSSSFL